MAKRDIEVVIKARDEASQKLKLIGGSALNMGSMIKKAALMIGVYFSGRAIKRFAEESLAEYGKQEQAMRGLVDALNLIGQGSRENVEELGKFASHIQDITEYGDELILDLAAMGAAMGKLSGETLQRAIKAAIGLSKAYGLELVGAMRLVARAAVGDTTTLTRYGIKLGEGLNKQEKFNRVLAIGERNFSLAEGAADTYVGRLAQMRNAIGDVKEAIGGALMPTIKAAAEHIRDWAKTNEELIANWAAKVISYTLLVKDSFVEFVRFMQHDWRVGLQFAFDTMVKMMEATFKTAVALAIAGGRGIWKGIKEGLMGEGIEERAERAAMQTYLKSGGELERKRKNPLYSIYEEYEGPLTPRNMELYNRLKTTAEKDILSRQTESILGGMVKNIAEEWKTAFEEIARDAPTELANKLGEAYDRHLERIRQIAAGPALPYGATAMLHVEDEIEDAIEKTRTIHKLPAREVRPFYMTMPVGKAEVDYQAQTAKNTARQLEEFKKCSFKLEKVCEYFRQHPSALPSYGDAGLTHFGN